MVFKEKFDYFDALKRQGDLAHEEALLLIDVLENFDPETLLERAEAIHAIENAADQQNHELFTHVATEFLTPIDREDIAEMAHRLDDIVDYIDDVVQQLYMYNIEEIFAPAFEMAEIIEKATIALVECLKEFHNFKKSKLLAGLIIEVNNLEEKADQIYFRTIRELYTKYTDDPVFIMAWSSIFMRLERCTDACENVADMMGTIALKNT